MEVKPTCSNKEPEVDVEVETWLHGWAKGALCLLEKFELVDELGICGSPGLVAQGASHPHPGIQGEDLAGPDGVSGIQIRQSLQAAASWWQSRCPWVQPQAVLKCEPCRSGPWATLCNVKRIEDGSP